MRMNKIYRHLFNKSTMVNGGSTGRFNLNIRYLNKISPNGAAYKSEHR